MNGAVILLVMLASSSLAEIKEDSTSVLQCPIQGQVVQGCKTCPATCTNPGLVCTQQCQKGCGCPPGQLIDETNNRCVQPSQCPIDCSLVLCALPDCPTGVRTAVAPGQCCPSCVCTVGKKTLFPGDTYPQDCNTCTCTKTGSVACTEKACLPVDPCASTTCPKGSQCEVFEPSGETFCNPSCDLDNGGCPASQTCSLQQVQCVRAPCPPVVECSTRCPIKGQVFTTCGTACPPTCSQPGPVLCTLQCVVGCQCPPGTVLDERNRECVRPEQCATNPCAAVQCLKGSRCEVFEPTGEPFCTPSCDLDNGGCPDGQICTIQDVQCVRAPCPSAIKCSDPCDSVRCPKGSKCEVYKPTGEVFCNPSCDLDNGGCSAGQTCSLEEVDCVRAPCPLTVKCECAPTCTPELCDSPKNKFKPCSRPPPFTIPPCPDSCHTTVCNACYYSDTALPTPSQCSKLCPFPPSLTCLKKWSNCVSRYSDTSKERDPDNFHCFNYNCPFIG